MIDSVYKCWVNAWIVTCTKELWSVLPCYKKLKVFADQCLNPKTKNLETIQGKVFEL